MSTIAPETPGFIGRCFIQIGWARTFFRHMSRHPRFALFVLFRRSGVFSLCRSSTSALSKAGDGRRAIDSKAPSS